MQNVAGMLYVLQENQCHLTTVEKPTPQIWSGTGDDFGQHVCVSSHQQCSSQPRRDDQADNCRDPEFRVCGQ